MNLLLLLLFFFILRGEYQVTKNMYIKVFQWNLSCWCMMMWFWKSPSHVAPQASRHHLNMRVFKLRAVSWEVIVRQQQDSAGQPKPLCHCLFIRLSVNALTYFLHCAHLNVFTVYTVCLYFKMWGFIAFLLSCQHKLNIFWGLSHHFRIWELVIDFFFGILHLI